MKAGFLRAAVYVAVTAAVRTSWLVAWFIGTLLVILLLSGCVTLTPAQEAGLQDLKVFAKRVTDHYGMAPVTILAGPSLNDRAGARPWGAGGLLPDRPHQVDDGHERRLPHRSRTGPLRARAPLDPGNGLAQTAEREL